MCVVVRLTGSLAAAMVLSSMFGIEVAIVFEVGMEYEWGDWGDVLGVY